MYLYVCVYRENYCSYKEARFYNRLDMSRAKKESKRKKNLNDECERSAEVLFFPLFLELSKSKREGQECKRLSSSSI